MMTQALKGRGAPRGAQGPRPNTWIDGPCAKTHEIRKAFTQQKNQAKFRKELWLIGFEDYKELWWDKWEQRGRKRDTYRSRRRDPDGDWTLDNFEIVIQLAGPQVTRRFHTPDGIFKTVTEARLHYGLNKQEMVDLQRNEPDRWYVIRNCKNQ